MTRLCLVRHGETDWNRAHRIQGWTDVPLNATGLAQAEAAARELAGESFDQVYSSTLLRASRTAEILALPHGLGVDRDARLRERNLGLLQGLDRSEIAARHPEVHELMRGRRPDYQPPGGESLAQFRARIEDWLREIVVGHPGQQLLVVSHGGVLDLVYRLASGQGFDSPRAHPLPNAALNWFVWRGERWWVETMGLDGHLIQAEDDRGI